MAQSHKARVRAESEQPIAELVQHVAELAVRVAELTRRIELSQSLRSGGLHLQDSEVTSTRPQLATESSASPIEFLTENGFSITRPWEAEGTSALTNGCFCFRVRDPQNNEREVTVKVRGTLVSDILIRTNDRIHPSSAFWICCAERRLANYVLEHERVPDGNEITVDDLDCYEMILAMRWGKT